MKNYFTGVQTVRDINKNKTKLVRFARNCDSGSGHGNSMRKSSNEELNAILL